MSINRVTVDIEYGGLLRATMRERERIWGAAHNAAVEAARREEQTIELERKFANATPVTLPKTGPGCGPAPSVIQTYEPTFVQSAHSAACTQAAADMHQRAVAEQERAVRDAHSPPEVEAAETESLAHRIERAEACRAADFARIEKLEAALAKHVELIRGLQRKAEAAETESLAHRIEKLESTLAKHVGIDMTVVDDKIEKLAQKLSEVSTAAQGWYQHFAVDIGGRWAPIDDKFGAVQKRLDKLEGNQSNTNARVLKLGKLLATADVAVR